MDKLLEEYTAYNPEEDFTMALGRSLADRCYKRYGTLRINDIIEEQKKWDMWDKIALRDFAFLGPGERITVKEVKERLSELKKVQYPVDSNYRSLGKKAVWAYFRQVKRDIRTHKYEQ
jgi:hypothetical protein